MRKPARGPAVRSRKRFGQNFLTDAHTISRIVDAISPAPDQLVVEIGPGHGELTGELVKSRCHLTAIEIDRDLVADLKQRFETLTIIETDVLKFDFSDIAAQAKELGVPLRIVGNLPYNISTPLLFKLFEYLPDVTDMHFMLQLEVVERMVARPSSENYGRLSVMSQYYCEATKLFSVPASAFRPKPRVMSAIVRLKPHRIGPVAEDTRLLGRMVNEAFSQRRKTIRNALGSFLSQDDIEALGLDPRLRPENLTVSDYVTCANYLKARQSS